MHVLKNCRGLLKFANEIRWIWYLFYIAEFGQDFASKYESVFQMPWEKITFIKTTRRATVLSVRSVSVEWEGREQWTKGSYTAWMGRRKQAGTQRVRNGEEVAWQCPVVRREIRKLEQKGVSMGENQSQNLGLLGGQVGKGENEMDASWKLYKNIVAKTIY